MKPANEIIIVNRTIEALVDLLMQDIKDLESLVKFCTEKFGPLIQSSEPEIIHTQIVKAAKLCFESLKKMEHGLELLSKLPWTKEGLQFFLDEETRKKILASQASVLTNNVYANQVKEKLDVMPTSPLKTLSIQTTVKAPVQLQVGAAATLPQSPISTPKIAVSSPIPIATAYQNQLKSLAQAAPQKGVLLSPKAQKISNQA